MRKILLIISMISFVACSKSKDDNGSIITQEQKSFFQASHDLDRGISASQETNPTDLNSTQKKIVDMLKNCTVMSSAGDGWFNTQIDGDTCPVSYTAQTKLDSNTNVNTMIDGVTVKDAEFEKLANFSGVKRTSTTKTVQTSTYEQMTTDMQAEFTSARWKTGTMASGFNYTGNYAGDKNHINFVASSSDEVKSETINLSFTIALSGTIVFENNSSTTQITSMSCTMNGAAVDCKQLAGAIGDNSVAKKTNQATWTFKKVH
jgi:hypothetical protein